MSELAVEWPRFVVLLELGILGFCTGVLAPRWHPVLTAPMRGVAASYSWLLVVLIATVVLNLSAPVKPTPGIYLGAALLAPAALGLLVVTVRELRIPEES